MFRNEAGGHRYQRVSPTERKGRIHTSTITVAILPIVENIDNILNEKDVSITTTRGGGPGGQNRNKVETDVIAVHTPTGIKVRCCSERSQYQNKQLAMSILASKVSNQFHRNQSKIINQSRQEQVGSGQRGDKILTLRTQDNTVKDERTGRKISFTEYSTGKIMF